MSLLSGDNSEDRLISHLTRVVKLLAFLEAISLTLSQGAAQKCRLAGFQSVICDQAEIDGQKW